MSKAFSTFYDHLLPELPGCATALVDLHLLQVARDFCNRTAAWREDFDSIDSVADTLAYDLFTPEAKTECVRLLSLTVNGDLQWALVAPPCEQDQPCYPADKPPFALNADGDQITLTKQPSGAIEISGAMRPTSAATSLPDFLYTEWLEAMRMGTLSRLMAMGRKHWTDREGAVFYAGEYAKKVTLAGTRAQNDNTRKPLRTRAWG